MKKIKLGMIGGGHRRIYWGCSQAVPQVSAMTSNLLGEYLTLIMKKAKSLPPMKAFLKRCYESVEKLIREELEE